MIELDDGIFVIGLGGNYVLVVGRVLKKYVGDSMFVSEIVRVVLEIVGEICVYMND